MDYERIRKLHDCGISPNLALFKGAIAGIVIGTALWRARHVWPAGDPSDPRS